MEGEGTKRAWGKAALASVLLMAWTVCPVFSLSLDRDAGCLELCWEQFWIGVDGIEATAALARNPAALSYRTAMLRLAAGSGNPAAVAALLRAGAPPNVRSEMNRNQHLLHEAARHNGEVGSVLLKGGAFPNPPGAWTPLHEAVRWGRVDAVAELLNAGANPEAYTLSGETPADLAERLGSDESALRLYREEDAVMPPPCGEPCKDDILALLGTPRPSPTPCGSLCEPEFWRSADRKQMQMAVEEGPAPPNWKAPGGSALHVAMKAGAGPSAVEFLLDHGADPNGRVWSTGETALHYAVSENSRCLIPTIRLLLAHGADPNIPDEDGWTPLERAKWKSARWFDSGCGVAVQLMEKAKPRRAALSR